MKRVLREESTEAQAGEPEPQARTLLASPWKFLTMVKVPARLAASRELILDARRIRLLGRRMPLHFRWTTAMSKMRPTRASGLLLACVAHDVNRRSPMRQCLNKPALGARTAVPQDVAAVVTVALMSLGSALAYVFLS